MIDPNETHGHGRGQQTSAVAEAARPLPWTVIAGGAASEGCDTVVTWTPAERRLLQALPDPGEVIEHEVWCGLEHGHPGPHWALGQVSGEDFWWLRWSDDTTDTPARRELVHHEVCGRLRATGEIGEPHVPCTLPHGHPGAHSYTRPA